MSLFSQYYAIILKGLRIYFSSYGSNTFVNISDDWLYWIFWFGTTMYPCTWISFWLCRQADRQQMTHQTFTYKKQHFHKQCDRWKHEKTFGRKLQTIIGNRDKGLIYWSTSEHLLFHIRKSSMLFETRENLLLRCAHVKGKLRVKLCGQFSGFYPEVISENGYSDTYEQQCRDPCSGYLIPALTQHWHEMLSACARSQTSPCLSLSLWCAGFLFITPLPARAACPQRTSWGAVWKPNLTTTVHMIAQQTLPFRKDHH